MPNRFEAAAAIMNILIEEGRNSMAFSYGEMTIKFKGRLDLAVIFLAYQMLKTLCFLKTML